MSSHPTSSSFIVPTSSKSYAAMSLTQSSTSLRDAQRILPPLEYGPQSDSQRQPHYPLYEQPYRAAPFSTPYSQVSGAGNHTHTNAPPVSMHPLDYAEQNPTARPLHILYQPNRPPSFTSPASEPQEFVGVNRPYKPSDHTQLTRRRQVKKIGQRREDHPLNRSHSPEPPFTRPYKNQSLKTQPSHSKPLHAPVLHHTVSPPIERVNPIQAPIQSMTSWSPYDTDPQASQPKIAHSPGRAMNNQPQRTFSAVLPPNTASRALPISGLLSNEVSYRITIRQQPIAARACGFGERDRRVIDPPPIVQLSVEESSATAVESLHPKLRNPFLVVHCSLWHAEEDTDYSNMDDTADRRQQRRLMGTLVASPFVGRDENGEEGCFFCFPDLSCRTTGRYRLKFILVVIDPTNSGPGTKAPFAGSVLSNVVQVYAAKDFPGMLASTPLTRRLKEQGCLISVKKGIEKIGDKSSSAHSRADSDEEEERAEEEEEEQEQSSKKSRGKRPKK